MSRYSPRHEKKAAAVVGILLLFLGAYLLLWPVTVDPVAWEPPVYRAGCVEADGLRRGRRAHRGRARAVRRTWRSTPKAGSTSASRTGACWCSTTLRSRRAPSRRPAAARSACIGRTDASSSPTAEKGLLAIDPAGKVSVLTTTCAGTKLVFTDDVDVTADGTVYFSDASSKYDQHHWKRRSDREPSLGTRLHLESEDLSDGRAGARRALLRERRGDRSRQQFVLVNETSRYRVRKLWIAGDKKGQSEMLIENLPGFPDNISTGTGGLFWIAIASPRNPVLDDAAGSPLLRKVIMRLPEALQPKPEKTARTLGVDETGRVCRTTSSIRTARRCSW